MSSTTDGSSNRNQNNSLPPNMQRLKDSVCQTRPGQIEDLWRGHIPSLAHLHAENMGWWATKEEVSELLHDENRLERIRQDLDSHAMQIGMYGQSQYDYHTANNLILYSPNCLGCNNPYDNPGACSHPGSPRPMPMLNPEINELAHVTLVILSVVNYLIAQEHVLTKTNKLALLLTPTKSQSGIIDLVTSNGVQVPSICVILALMDNCSRAFPKLAHQAAALLSLLICTSPAAAFSCLDGKAFVDSIWKYLSEIFRLVHNSDCRVEEYFGVVAFLNILPSLYHFGNWNEAKSSHQFNDFVAFFTSVTINICHGSVWKPPPYDDSDLEDIDDPQKNLEQLPELQSAKVLMESLLLVKEDENTSEGDNSSKPADWRVQFLHERPKTFTVVAGLEVLGWWIAKGIDLTLARIDCGDDPDETVQSCIEEYEPRIRLLMKASGRNEELTTYIDPILAALKENKKKGTRPDPSISLLYGPFIFDNRRCGFCQKTSKDIGKDLLRCGGCGEMQHYCCKDHQKSHWKTHKFFCKRNAGFSQYKGR